MSIQAVIVNGSRRQGGNSTWETGAVGPRPRRGRSLFKSFKSERAGKKVGSRFVITSTAADAFGDTGNESLGVKKDDPIVFVVDLVSATKPLDEAKGKAVAPKAGLPTVTMNEGKPATITVPKGAKAPTKTIVAAAHRGHRPRGEEGPDRAGGLHRRALEGRQRLRLQRQPPRAALLRLPDRQGQVIKGWDNGLVGQKVGSRVLLVIPPAEGYGTAGSPPKIAGTDTLVFVVDILAAY